MAEIEHLEIRLQELLRNFVVEGLMSVMPFLQKASHGGCDIPRVRFRIDLRRRERDGQKDCRQDKEREKAWLHSGKEVSESRRNRAERKEATRVRIICW